MSAEIRNLRSAQYALIMAILILLGMAANRIRLQALQIRNLTIVENSLTQAIQTHSSDDLTLANRVPATLDEQAKCLKGAEAAFKLGGYDQGRASFQNHFNKPLGRCFVEIYTFRDLDATTTIEKITLRDAFEGREYGSLTRHSSEGSLAQDCSVVMPNGEIKLCHTAGSFEELARTYME